MKHQITVNDKEFISSIKKDMIYTRGDSYD